MAAFSTTKHLTRKDAGAAAAHPASACSGGTGSRKLHLPHSLGCPLSLRGFSVTISSLPLFDEGPGKDYSVSEVLARSKPAGKAQQRFRKLVATIERKREELRGWQAYRQRYNQRVTTEFEVVRLELRQQQRQMAVLIDELLSQRGQSRRLSRVERAKLRDMLMSLLDGLLSEGHDEVLADLREKHASPSAKEDQRLEMELTESLLTDVLGLDVDENHGASSVEELLAHAQSKMQQRAQSRRAEERATGRRAKRSAAGDAARGKREQAAKEVSQSLRDVFRKLVSALHPDREPDPAQRARKNQLMQRVNQAYDANDLLTLLGLQLEIEQIDTAHLSSTTAERLAHYNQILSEQLARLEAELESFIEPYRELMGGWSGQALTVADVDRKLTMDVAQLREAVRQLTQDLTAFRDPARLRARLRQYDLDDEPGELEAMQEMMEIATMLGDFRPPRRPRRR